AQREPLDPEPSIPAGEFLNDASVPSRGEQRPALGGVWLERRQIVLVQIRLVAIEKAGSVEKPDKAVDEPVTVYDREIHAGIEPASDLLERGGKASEIRFISDLGLELYCVGENMVDPAF